MQRRLGLLSLLGEAMRITARGVNTFVEQFIDSIEKECIVHFSTRHLTLLGREDLDHYHNERPYHSLDNRTVRA